MERTEKLKIVSTIIIVGFTLAIFYHYIMGAYMEYGYPYNTFLYKPKFKFTDFTDSIKAVESLSPFVQGKAAYYPFGMLLFYAFGLLKNQYLILSTYFAIFFIGWFFFIFKNFSQQNKSDNLRDLFIIGLTSYPLLFTIDRGNLELYVFLLVAGFCFFYSSNNKYQSLFGSICLSLAIAIKPFPAIFLLLLVIERKWKNIFFILLSTLLITIASSIFFHEGFLGSLNALKINQAAFFTKYVIGNASWDHQHSLFSLFKVFLYLKLYITHIKVNSIYIYQTNILYNFYSIISIAIFIIITGYILLKERCLWKILALLVFGMLLLTPVSPDYRLIYIFIPLAFFINDPRSANNNLIYSILFGLLLIPKIYTFVSSSNGHGLDVGLIINPLLMMFFVFLILKEGFSLNRLPR
jgi:hypothetical protein